MMAQIENKIRNLLDGKFEVDKFRTHATRPIQTERAEFNQSQT